MKGTTGNYLTPSVSPFPLEWIWCTVPKCKRSVVVVWQSEMEEGVLIVKNEKCCLPVAKNVSWLLRHSCREMHIHFCRVLSVLHIRLLVVEMCT